ncbi:MAG: nitroreductase family protein [Candidatus Magnetoovum sp. WYHC-5]|nr:nitroreductase family protein [Candidatus Magnetoovum sp. WYHC-5]
MIETLVRHSRTVRRFYEGFFVPKNTLRGFIDLARLCPSAGNLQPLKYIISNTPETNDKIFSTLAWAAYLTNWQGPEVGEHPSAYIIMLGDKSISKNIFCDHGIAAQTIMLGAREAGLGGCIIVSIKKDELKHTLNIKENLEILLIIALGKPKEEVIITEIEPEQGIKYYRDNKGVHYVPKRKLDDIIIELL